MSHSNINCLQKERRSSNSLGAQNILHQKFPSLLIFPALFLHPLFEVTAKRDSALLRVDADTRMKLKKLPHSLAAAATTRD